MDSIYLLRRIAFGPDGIISQLFRPNGAPFLYTLSHAFADGENAFKPLTPPGLYTCILGQHRLHKNPAPFAAYEILGIPNHSGVLFHVGNYNRDSDGCELLGLRYVEDHDGAAMVASSGIAYASFMSEMGGTPQQQYKDAHKTFLLKVE